MVLTQTFFCKKLIFRKLIYFWYVGFYNYGKYQIKKADLEDNVATLWTIYILSICKNVLYTCQKAESNIS